MRRVLDAALQNAKAVNLGGEFRCNGRFGEIAFLSDHSGGPGSIGLDYRRETERAYYRAALPQRMGVAVDRLDRLKCGRGWRHKLMVDAFEMLSNDVEAGIGQEVMDVGDAARDRVLDRDHGVACCPAANGRDCVLKSRAGNRVQRLAKIDAGDMGVGPRLPLVGDVRLRL